MLTANYEMKISAIEEITSQFVAGSNNTVTANGLSLSGQLTASSGIPATKQAVLEVEMTAGAATVDLTNLAGLFGAVDMSGLRMQLAILQAHADNANPITVEAGASNGYNVLGASGEVTLAAGQAVMFFGNEAAPDVGGAAKTIDVSGTGAQKLLLHLVFG